MRSAGAARTPCRGGMRLSSVCQAGMRFALDALQNMLAAAMALCVLRVRIRPLFVFFAAVFGAFAALAANIAGLSRDAGMMLWLPIAMGMMRIAAGREARVRRAFGRAAVLLACEGFLGGVVLALWGATGSLAAAHALSAGGAGAVFVSARRSAAAAGDVRRVHVTCRVAGKECWFDAIADSGNSLRDYLTHRPVIVAGMQVYARMENVRTRLIFADTAGGRQMMQLVIPDGVTLVIGRERRQVAAALAFSPGMRGDMPALVPASLLKSGDDRSTEGEYRYGENAGYASRREGGKKRAPDAERHPTGGLGMLHRRKRLAARAAEPGGGNRAVCAHEDAAAERTPDAD